MAQQTAVDWLIKEIESLITIETFQKWKILKEQAKQMEKEQHQISFNKGYDRRNYIHDFEYGGVEYWEEEPKEFEQYYNETYGSKGSDGNFKQFSLYERKETITSADIKKAETMGLYDKIELTNPNDSIFTYSQTEISDEEIYKEAEHKSKIFRGWTEYETSAWVMACQWYREQLKNK